jgi:hypothetical protein
MEFRMQEVKARKGLDGDSAKQFLRELDRVRSRRSRALFNTDWQDPVIYDLVINSARISTDSAAHLVAETVGREDFRATPESEKAFQDLTTTARVQAALITSPKTRNIILNVRSDGGQVNISGILADPDLENEIVRIAKSVDGVTHVTTDIEPPPIEYMHP